MQPAVHFPPGFEEPDPARAAWLGRTALDQAEAVRRGEVTSAALLEMYLDRVARLDARVGAFVHLRAEKARAEARRKDAARGRASRARSLPPFHGIPVAVKDLHMLRGAPMRLGSRAWRYLWSPVDDLTVRALRAAGFVVFGKTSTSELALMPMVETDLHPPTRNPWRLERISGGSSGGAAAAVAAGLLPIAPGSDGGGSVRLPAAMCGLVGLKPTRGGIPNPHARVDFLGMTAIGPLAHTALDAAALADVLCGREPGAPGSWLASARDRPPPRLRVALMLEPPLDGAETAASHAAAARAAADALAARGHLVSEIDRVSVRLEEFLPIYQRLFVKTPVLFESKLQPVTRWFREQGRRYSDDDALQAMARLADRALEAGRDFDLLVSPTVPVPTPRVGQFAGMPPREMFHAVAPLGSFTAPWNVTGRPALTLPWGRDRDGLPLGVQLVGLPGDEPRLFALARDLEAEPSRRNVYPVPRPGPE